MTYTVVYDDSVHVAIGKFPVPERLPQPGDVYVWTEDVRTLGGGYRAGDRMVVIKRTMFNPHHRLSSLGNLLIRGPHGTSVWTEFDAAVAEDRLKLVESRENALPASCKAV